MIYKRLGLDLDRTEVISLVGAGGKTSLINGLSEELKSLNKRVLSTTTTQVFKPSDGDYFFLEEIDGGFIPSKGSITSYGEYIRDDKLIGPTKEKIDKIINRDIFDYILIEADGSKRMPLKAPGDHEPVISSLSTITIGLIGLDSIGLKLDDSKIHRANLLAEIIGKEIGSIIDEEDIIKIILHERGLFKDSVGKKIFLLNKANSKFRIDSGKYIRERLDNTDIKTLICNIMTKEFY